MKDEVKKISLKAFTHLFGESKESNRRFCFILGSGASREAGILTGVEMAKIWANDLEKKYEDNEINELMAKLNIDSIEPDSKNYFGLYELRFYPEYQEGYAYLERELEKGNPSLGHYALAKILAGEKHNLVITTNFDSLIEDALFIYTNRRPLVVGHESLTEFINLNIERPIIAKIHRSLYFRPFNRQPELDGLAKGWQDTLKNAFMVYTPIVIGYAGGDHSLMEFLKSNDITMNGLYWCYWDKEEPSEEIQELVISKKGCLVPIDGFDQMMFMLSRKLSFKNPEEEIKQVTQKRIERYNEQYEEFEKRIREEANNENSHDKDINETIQEIDIFNELQLKEAEKRLEKEQTHESYFSKGCINKRMSKFAEAIADYTKAIELKPDYEKAYNNRGNAYNGLEEYDKAIADHTKAIELKPDYEKAYYNRGNAYNGLEEYDKAIADYTKAIELKPDYVKVYNNRGVAYNGLEEYDKAIADYTKAIELKPDYVKAYNNRGNAYNGLEEYDKAIADYTKAIELKPDHVNAYNNRGNAYNGLEEYDKAIADYTKAIELKPDYEKAYYNRGNAYNGLEEYDKAIADCTKAIELKPDYVKAYSNRGVAYNGLEEYDKAIADYTKAEELRKSLQQLNISEYKYNEALNLHEIMEWEQIIKY